MKKLLSALLIASLWCTAPIQSSFSQTNTSTQNKKEITVCITKTGKKYHRCSCSYLRKSSIEISKKEAIRIGYTPCSRCNP